MKQSNRACKMRGHEDNPISHICNLLECTKTRWSCAYCISEGIHSHNKPNNYHIVKIKDFLIELKGEQEKAKQHLQINITILEKINQQVQRLESSIIEYRKYYKIQTTQNKEKLELILNNRIQDNFEKLEYQKIKEILKINILEENQYLLPIDHLQLQLHSIGIKIKEYLDNKNYLYGQIIDIKNRKYKVQEIEKTKIFDWLYGSSISKNEQYLTYGGRNQLLKIYNITLKKQIKVIKLFVGIQCCQFTQDSQKIYVGLDDGQVQGFEVKNYKRMFKKKIHSQTVFSIITIYNQYLITNSDDKSIIKTSIKTKQQIYKLTVHSNSINALAYTDFTEMIVTGSQDKSIQLWSCRNKSIIINKQQAHDYSIDQLQLINDNEGIFSLDGQGNLYKWKIDLINRDLIKLEQVINEDQICSFQSINQDENLLLICQKYAKILNQKREILNVVDYGGICAPIICKQLDNLRYIQILANSCIILATAYN